MSGGRPLMVRLHAATVGLLSPRFRRRYGEQIGAAFADLYEEAARSRRPLATQRLFAREILGVIAESATGMRRGLTQGLGGDIRFAMRVLRKRPAPTLVMVGMIAVAIAANATVFRVVHRVLLQPLPFHQPDRLTALWSLDTESGRDAIGLSTAADFRDLQSSSTTLAELTAAYNGSRSLTAQEGSEAQMTQFIATNYFDLFGIAPAMGRGFVAEDGELGASPVAILSHELWQQLGGDPDVIGSVLEFDQRDTVIVGVMPAGYRYPVGGNSQRMWAPMVIEDWDDREQGRLFVFGRMRDDVSIETVRAEISAIAEVLGDRYPDTNRDRGARTDSLHDAAVQGASTGLSLLMAAVGFVLLIACLNVANLQLSRAIGRADEVALRMAIGAGRNRIVRQLLVESCVLAAMGSSLGLFVAVWTEPFTAHLIPPTLDTEFYATASVNSSIILFTVAVTVATVIVTGCAPAYGLLRRSVPGQLVSTKRTSETAHSRRLRGGLAIAEISLSLVLLAGTGLMVRSLAALQQMDVGVETDRVAILRTGVRGARYETPEAQAAFFSRVVGELETRPEVASATTADRMPPQSAFRVTPFTIGSQPGVSAGSEARASLRVVGPGYFRTLGIPVVEGVSFDPGPWAGGEPVVLVNQVAAEMYWPGGDALGDEIVMLDGRNEPRRVIGIVGAVRSSAIPPDPEPEIYLPFDQRPLRTMTIAIRTQGSVPTILETGGALISDIEPTFPVYNMTMLQARFDDANAPVAATVQVLAVFASLALLLVTVGVYAVISQSVAERGREFGIRRALGARGADVLGLAVREGLRIMAWGLPLGLLGALALSRALAGLIYGIPPTDPVTFLSVAAGLLGVVVAASSIPGLRAMRADPTVALRD